MEQEKEVVTVGWLIEREKEKEKERETDAQQDKVKERLRK